MVPIALAYGAGLVVADRVGLPLVPVFGAAAVLVAACAGFKEAGPRLIWLLLAVMGAANFTLRTAVLSPNDLRGRDAAPAQVTVRARLVSAPEERVSIRPDRTRHVRTLTEGAATHLREEKTGAWTPAHGRVLIVNPGPAPQFHAGDTVEVEGVLRPPPEAIAPGLFDQRLYLVRRGIFFQLESGPAAEWREVRAGGAPLSARWVDWARATLARGLPEADDSLRLLWSMTLGLKTGLAAEDYEPFVRTGTMHIFAISGLHVALISGMLVGLLRAAGVGRVYCGAVVLPLLWFYTGATGWQPSAIRATIMMSVVVGGWALSRPADLVNSLFAAAFMILVWDPRQLFGASFQLSFLVVLSIAALVPQLERGVDRLLRTDPLRPPELAGRWERLVRAGLSRGLKAGAVSVAAWLGALPLTLHYFHLVSPVTVLANLVMVPLSSAALACNMGSLALGWFWTAPTEWLNHAAWGLMRLMMEAGDLGLKLPASSFHCRGPGVAGLALYYGVLAAVFSGWAFDRRRARAVLAGVAAVLLSAGAWAWMERGRVAITVLPAQGGMAVFSRAPAAGPPLLVDCGDTNGVEYVTLRFLRSEGVNDLAELVLSHGDIRHVGGAGHLRAWIPIERVVASRAPSRSPVYRKILGEASASGRLRTVGTGDAVSGWRVEHPELGDRFARADDSALVLAAEFSGVRILLVSDLGREGQERLLERHPEQRADIVITGLPARGEPLCDAWLDRLDPGLIVVGDSDLPAQERAAAGTMARLARRGIPVLYTRELGAVRVVVGRGEATVTAHKRPGARWVIGPRSASGAGAGSGRRSRRR